MRKVNRTLSAIVSIFKWIFLFANFVVVGSAANARTYADRPCVFRDDYSFFTTRSLGLGRYSLAERAVADGRILSEFAFGPPIEAIAYSPKADLLVATGSGRYTIWRDTAFVQATGKAFAISHVHEVQFSPNGRFLVFSHHCGTIEVRDSTKGDLLSTYSIADESVLSCCVDNIGRWAIAVGLSGAYSVDLRTSSHTKILDFAIPPACISGDGKIVAITRASSGLDEALIFDFASSGEGSLSNQPVHSIQDCRIVHCELDNSILGIRGNLAENNETVVQIMRLKNHDVTNHVIKWGPAKTLDVMVNRLKFSPSANIAGYVSFNGSARIVDLKTNVDWKLTSRDNATTFRSMAIAVLALILGSLLYLARCVQRVKENQPKKTSETSSDGGAGAE